MNDIDDIRKNSSLKWLDVSKNDIKDMGQMFRRVPINRAFRITIKADNLR